MHDWFDMGHGWGMMWWWAVLPLLLVVAYLYTRNSGRAAGGDAETKQPSESALDVAKRRYAAGELSRDDYLQVIEDLSDRPGAGED